MNRSCSLGPRLESILPEGLLKILFQQYRPDSDLPECPGEVGYRGRSGQSPPLRWQDGDAAAPVPKRFAALRGRIGLRVLWSSKEGAGSARGRCLGISGIAESEVPLRRSPCAGAGTGTKFPPMTDVSPLVPARRGRSTVNATELGVHLALTRQRISALADTEHVIERLPDGRFDQDACRFAYLKWLRDPARRSARSEAAVKHAEAKTQLLHIRIEEKQRRLVRREDVNELIDAIAGIVLTHLSGMAARCSRDMVVRRNIDAVVMQIRREIAAACIAKADERNEPPLDEQG